MHRFKNLLVQLVRSDDGPTAVEYAVMLALILLACLAAIGTVGNLVGASFKNSANSIAS